MPYEQFQKTNDVRIYFINLDRHADRRRRMCEILQGLPFERIAAVDGRTVEGPELRAALRPYGYEHLNRYERALFLSHRVVWTKFLETGDRLACVLEDDVVLSPSFGDFIRDESWFPPDATIVKLETYDQRVVLSRQTIQLKDRRLAILKSRHLGTAGYVISRASAAYYMEKTIRPDRGIDYIVFGESATKENSPIYQICPALCIQAKRLPGGLTHPELASSLQFYAPVPRKPLMRRLQKEIPRPFLQLGGFLWSVASGHRFHERRCNVEFA